jgi:signal transduction histidine kinase/CheY-like chemotaxis protein
LIAILPTVAFSAFLLLRYGASERELAERTLIESARAVANAVDAKFLTAEAALLVLRESVLLEDQTLAEFETRLRGAAAQTQLTFVLIDGAGRQLINTAVPRNTALGVSDTGLWAGVFDGGLTVVSGVIRGPTTGRLLAAVGVPVYRNGSVRWALTAELFLEDFEPIITEPGVPADWIVSIVDKSGVHLVRSHMKDEFAGKPLVSPLVEHMKAGARGTLRTISLEGIPLISTVQFARRSGWAAAVGLPVASLDGPVYRSLRDLGAIGLGAGALAIALALFVARALSRAFGRLTSAAASVGRGEIASPSPTVVREINAVADVLAATSRELNALTRNLENLVVERTRSLSEANTALRAEIDRRQESEDQLRQVQKIEAVGQLTGGIAHDFNNMMAVVLSALSLIKRRLGNEASEVGQYIDGARQAAERAANLTARLLAFSRQQALAPEVVDLRHLFGELREVLARTIPENIAIEIDVASDAWPIFADRQSLENALLNLAINARDAMPDGGRLAIEVSNMDAADIAARGGGIPPGEAVSIAVRDTGSGISKDVIDRVFDPFFTTKPSGEGTGLGLSQVHGFIKQSGGHIAIDSAVGEGTTVVLYFPRSEREASLAASPPPAEVSSSADAEVVLVVEDAPTVRRMTVAMVEELGYRALEAEDATRALAMLDAHPEIKVMLTDVVMPGVDGKRLAEQALDKYPRLAVLFATGYAKSGDLDRFSFDPDQLITKPYTLETLAARLRVALDRLSAPATGGYASSGGPPG